MARETITLDTLRAVRIPARTETYMPVPHGNFVDLVTDVSRDNGFYLKEQSYECNKDGQIMVGKLTFHDTSDDGMDYQIGVMNSYNKTKTASLGIGSVVRICSNGMLSADHVLKRKHTTLVWNDLTTMVEETVYLLRLQHDRNKEARMVLKDHPITLTEYSEIVGRMFIEEQILTVTQLAIIQKEKLKSTYSEFSDNSMWSLYNHITHSLKSAHPADYIEQHVNTHQFIMSLV